ncbi:MAG: hypothetical protein NTV88_04180 [Candidatus Micrarchaeota archaeon]|nr:hypothetical protein [Candidatus Micrarchaeota archaeon]
MKSKKADFSEWYTEITKEAGLCDLRYNVKGFVVFMPWSVMSMKKMYSVYEKELEAKGHKPAWFPALIPESNFHKEASHVKGFTPEVFWVEKAGDNVLEERLAMRPTSETALKQKRRSLKTCRCRKTSFSGSLGCRSYFLRGRSGTNFRARKKLMLQTA